jgi:hypothetical protein
VEVLDGLGVTEESTGCEIRSMDVETIGETSEASLFILIHAYHADGIIVMGRIKPHTDFKIKLKAAF